MDESSDPLNAVSYKGAALFDPVRYQYFRRFEEALNYYQACILDLSTGSVPKQTATFISKVIVLYVEIKPKLYYATSQGEDRDEKATNKLGDMLSGINDYLKSGNYRPKTELSKSDFQHINIDSERKTVALFLEFSNYFLALRDFFEVNGITKYEFPKYDETEQPIRAMAYG